MIYFQSAYKRAVRAFALRAKWKKITSIFAKSPVFIEINTTKKFNYTLKALTY
jgi:hypothetical protein